MSPHYPRVEVVPAGSDLHRRDVVSLRGLGLHLPHTYASWPLHERHGRWRWCRLLGPSGELVGGYSLELTRSRALPGVLVGRIERLGRTLHADVQNLGELLVRTARSIPRLERLDVQLFDEEDARLERLVERVTEAGFQSVGSPRSYRRTLILPLYETESAFRALLGSRVRSSLRKFEATQGAVIAPIRDRRYVGRMHELYEKAFLRTGASAPAVDFNDVLSDSASGTESLLAGVYWNSRSFPQDLVAMTWGRLQGDYVSYDIGASDRADDLGQVPLGYPLIFNLANWARDRGATWLDMGGVIPLDAPPTHPLQGISFFKRGFSTDEREVAAEYRFEPRPKLTMLIGGLRRLARATLR